MWLESIKLKYWQMHSLYLSVNIYKSVNKKLFSSFIHWSIDPDIIEDLLCSKYFV